MLGWLKINNLQNFSPRDNTFRSGLIFLIPGGLIFIDY